MVTCYETLIAIRSRRNEPVVSEILLNPTVISKDEYQPYDQPLESRTCPSWDDAAKLGTKWSGVF